ncbi:TetR/AcrR family transcriptional regulator [Bordetella petrii]|uniref:TetR/AcrR family transcriptional regulator n=1 Tax=Bordetella petrii TaxID=94624 RepID=UPI001E510C8E|nr:TetR/AcrR family transcriptional regulator [Bordetella petrii]MCD0505757.1 TetR/AcrR family transcriptional regulator [Bordetella petrii]
MTRKSDPSRSAREPARPAADRIRETARRMFYQDGIRAVGVDALVAEAGVTKPSLYRSFSSKDELAASYLRDYEAEFWVKFNAGDPAHPGDPRAGLMAYFEGLARRVADSDNFRGCGLTNAAVEYPEAGHPARQVAVANKKQLRARMVELARDMGAGEPEILADGLLLLLEGAFVSGQLFGQGGPARHLPEAARRLIDASLR